MFLCFWAAFSPPKAGSRSCLCPAPGDDQQVRFLQSAEQVVEVDQTSRHAENFVRALRKRADLIIDRAQDFGDGLQIMLQAVLAKAKTNSRTRR